MSNVIEFVNRGERNNQDIERGLRDGLKTHGFSPNAIDAAVDSIMPLMKESKEVLFKNLSFSINSDIDSSTAESIQKEASKSLQKYQSDASAFVLKIMLLLAIEIAKYNEQ